MRRHLTSVSTGTLDGKPEEQLICQKEAIRIMRVAGRKNRYAAAFETSGLRPAEITGNTIWYWRHDAVASRKRLDEIEQRKLSDHQGTLPLQEARKALVGTLSGLATARACAEGTQPPLPPLPSQPIPPILPPPPPPPPIRLAKAEKTKGVTIHLVIADANAATLPWEKLNQMWQDAASMAAVMGCSDIRIRIK